MKKVYLFVLSLFMICLCGCSLHVHLFELEVIPPTCVSQGYTEYTCECGETAKSDFIQPQGHEFSEWSLVQEPTFTTPGYKERVCSLCGEKEKEELYHEHTYTETVVEVTCTTNGYTEYTCECGDSYKDNYVNALHHDYSDFVVTKEPTETQGGKKEKTCSRCPSKIVLDIPKLDHVHQYNTTVISPTCTEKGYTKYTCECGYSYKDDYVNSQNHDFDKWVIIKEATEFFEGSKERTCKKCSYKETEEIKRLDHVHQYTKNVISPTCTQGGYTEYVCYCKDSYMTNVKEALGHNYSDFVVTKEPTETQIGKKEKICNRCSDKVVVDIPELGHIHKYNKKVISKTCTTDGYTEYTCTCGDTYKENIIKATGHNYTKNVVSKTCTTDGYTEYTCTCGDTYNDNIIKATGHNYIKNVVSNTCTTDGYTEYTCTCGDTYTNNITVALGHNYTNWTVIKEATETSVGLKEKTCTLCNNLITEEIPRLDHVHAYRSVVTKPTCIHNGYTEYFCTCGDTYKNNIVEALGHNYTNWTIIKEATEYTLGLQERSCISCSVVEREIIERLDHVHKYSENIINPTCTNQGYTEYLCVCGDKYTSNYINALGHNLQRKVIEKANYTKEGEIKEYCVVCSYVKKIVTSAYNCKHECEVSTQFNNSDLNPGLKIISCIYCCNQYMEFIEASSPVSAPTMSLKEYSNSAGNKSIIQAEKIFKEVISKNEKELFNIPYMSLNEYKEVRSFTLDLIKNCKTEREKTKVIYDWIIDNLVYDTNAYTYSVYQTFKTKKAVCFGYTSLLHDMLSAADIMSSYVSGYTTYDNLEYTEIFENISNSNSHAWIYAYVDGEVLIMDPTWADGYNDKEYGFDMDINSMYKTHMVLKIDETAVIPEGIDYRLYSNLLYSFDKYTIYIDKGVSKVDKNNPLYKLKVTRNLSYSVYFIFNCSQTSISHEDDIYCGLVKNGFYCVSVMASSILDNWTYSTSNGLSHDINTVIEYVDYLNNECGYNIQLDIPQDLQNILK